MNYINGDNGRLSTVTWVCDKTTNGAIAGSIGENGKVYTMNFQSKWACKTAVSSGKPFDYGWVFVIM